MVKAKTTKDHEQTQSEEPPGTNQLVEPQGMNLIWFQCVVSIDMCYVWGNRTHLKKKQSKWIISPYSVENFQYLLVCVRWSLFNKFVLVVFPLPFAIHLKTPSHMSHFHMPPTGQNPLQKDCHIFPQICRCYVHSERVGNQLGICLPPNP